MRIVSTVAIAILSLLSRISSHSNCGLHLLADTKRNLLFSMTCSTSHDPFPLNKEDGTTYSSGQKIVTMKEWQPWARKLTQAVRHENPDALVFVGGTNWAYDLRGMPMDVENLVYSTHVYPNKGRNWSEAFGNLSQSKPVFVGEFGGSSDIPGDLEFVRSLMRYMRELEIGWTAWSWSNEPFLVTRYVSSAFGEAVRQELSGA